LVASGLAWPAPCWFGPSMGPLLPAFVTSIPAVLYTSSAVCHFILVGLDIYIYMVQYAHSLALALSGSCAICKQQCPFLKFGLRPGPGTGRRAHHWRRNRRWDVHPPRASQAPDGPATATHPSGASSPQLRRRCPLGRPFCFQPPCSLARLGSTPSPCPLPPLAPVVLRPFPPPPFQPRARCSQPRPPLYLGAQHTNASALLSRARASLRAPGSCGRGARQCAML